MRLNHSPEPDRQNDVTGGAAPSTWGIETGSLRGSLPMVLSQKVDDLVSPITMRPSLGEGLQGRMPQVASMPVSFPSPKTLGCLLPEGRALLAPQRSFDELAKPLATDGPKTPKARKPSKRHTRIRPPADIVKFEDRLAYLLQPPLEALIEARSLRFPFKPFGYQMDGVAFLFPRRHAVIADEMGLGKTMQAITAIRLLAHSGQLRRALLVCPKPLMTNWQRELAMWAPELSVAMVDGSPTRRSWIWSESTAVVTIAGYETVVRDKEILHSADQRFDLVVLDESQRIKNLSSATNDAVRGIARDRSWALTGTPIENSADDLVGIFEFVSPGVLRLGMRPREMGGAVRDTVLRRTKEKVLTDLPPKINRDATIDLTPEQWESYQRAEEDGVIRLEGLEKELTIHHVFELVLRLKQICNFDPTTGASSKAERLEADLEECVASGRKAIVFSQWVNTIERLDKRLERFSPGLYHGGVPQNRRDGVLDRFRDDPNCNVLLMSYGAGSVGLNLQFAGYVFLFDRWWNPAVEDQAINRAHRIGATGSVTVSRFLCEGTIEQRIDEVLRTKRQLFDEVFSEGSDGPRRTGLTRQDLLSLFQWRTSEGPLTDAA